MKVEGYQYFRIIDNAETGFRLEYQTTKKGSMPQVYQLYAASADEAKFEVANMLSLPEASLPPLEFE